MIDVSPETMNAAGTPIPMAPVAIDGLFGWYSPGINARGVILCGSYGFEQLSAHRAWRELADRIAATGCATLRFDYPGQGDSADDGAGQATAWIAAIRRAIRFLREEARSEEIVLIGLRLGGTLAALAAQEGGVDRLVLLSPFASGRAYLREMKMQGRTIGLLSDGSPLPEEPGYLSVGGFRLASDLVAELSAINLATVEHAPAPRILLLGDVGGLATRYTALGSAVSSKPFPGLAQLLSNPLFAEMPDEAFTQVVAFAAEEARPRLLPALAPKPAAAIRGDTWSEESVCIGRDIFGVHCRPYAPALQAPTVLFVNAGTNVHSGWGRNTTSLARKLSRDGVPSLRVDLRGVGDSPDRESRASPLYDLELLDDVRCALDYLEALGSGPVVIVGACSGAYLGFHAVCREPRIQAALLINLYCFDWNPDDDVAETVRSTVRSASTYAGMLRNGSSLRRLLRGEVRVAAIGAQLGKAGLRRAKRLLRPAPPGGSVARRVAELRRRGARLRLVYSAGDTGLAALSEHLGRSPARVARRLGEPAVVIENADHDLSTVDAQVQLAAILRDVLLGLWERRGAQTGPGRERSKPKAVQALSASTACRSNSAR